MIDTGSRPLTPDDAREYIAQRALSDRPPGPVGVELESHLVDLERPQERVSHSRLLSALHDMPPLPGGSAITVEPGGQVELSGPPAVGPADAVEGVRRDHEVLRATLASRGLGLALVGADPARPAARVNPGARYAAMETHFTATGRREAGMAMMCSTASVQVNLEAGPTRDWAERVSSAHRLGPVMVAISACSPLLGGRVTGWRSTRQQVWGRLDARRCGPLPRRDDPTAAWAEYALAAPVMLVCRSDDGGTEAPRATVPLADWVGGRVQIAGRRPTLEDLALHLTTLFPPVRLRGFLEVRYLDAVPTRWWPALVTILATTMDDPAAAQLAAEATEPVSECWADAARDGLAHPGLARAAKRCVEAAADALPPDLPAALRSDVTAYAELIAAGRSPGDDLADRAATVGALEVLREYAHA